MSLRHSQQALIASTAFLTAATVQAADLDLANIPLFLGQSSQPNILFLMDDSGSMDWEVMTTSLANGGRFVNTQPDGSSAPGDGSVRHRDADGDGSADCGFSSGDHYGYDYIVEFGSNRYGDNSDDCNTADDRAWRIRNSDFNPLYYDPTATYTPWAGVDAAGNAFANIDPTNAPDDPYNPQSRINLLTEGSNWTGGSGLGTQANNGVGIAGTGFRYYTWNDSDNDGFFDDGEETEVLVSSLNAAQQTNFANWFSYYRSRDYVAKAAYGQLIAQATNQRMGLVTLHDNAGVSNIAIAEMNADPTTGAKKALLDALYQFSPGGGTPLRSTANECGKYLSCDTNTLFGTCPRLSLADGGNCQQNFLVMMTDGLWNGGSPGVGNTDGPGAGNTAWDGGAYADGFDNMLADVAMQYYENDIHTDFPNDLPVVQGVDEATHQHVVTYSVAFGVNGSVTAMPADPTAAFTWPQGVANTASTVDDLRHAAFNGRGEFLSARSAQELIDALNDAILSIGQRTSSASSAAVNATTLNLNSQVYQARFNSEDWSGDFFAFTLNLDGSIGASLGEAGDRLDALGWSARTLLTHQAGTGGVALRWSALSAAQQTAFRTNPDSGVVEDNTTGMERMLYTRGKRTFEAATPYFFRERSTLLGDLIHSSPLYVGPDTIFGYPDSLEANPYSDFVTNTVIGRTPMIYIGANDGFLHGFNADASSLVAGREEIAYLPGFLLPEVNQLTDPAYIHRFYVDGDSNFQDVYYNNAWHTALVGSARHGGQGYFALDVSDPADFTEANANNLVLWEFTDADDADLGYSYSQAAIVKLANGRWAAIFGNGYNATEADGNASTTGDAVLFIVDIETGALIRKISTETGTAEDPTGNARPNGLATPAVVDFNGDYIADYVYAGDLFGNLWKFDIQDSTPANWDIPFETTTAPLVPVPLFVAEVDMGNGFPPNTSPNVQRQPITVRPAIGFHPDGQGLLIYFGTGQYIETGDHDNASQVTQSYYAVWDDFPSTGSPPGINRSNMLEQEIIKETTVATVPAPAVEEVRLTTNRLIDWNTDKGWYMDLYNTNEGGNAITDNLGERVTSNSIIRNGRIIFNTQLPTGDQCTFGGTSWIMQLDAYQGSRLTNAAFDTSGDGDFGSTDNVTDSVTADDNGDGTTTTETAERVVSGLKVTSGMTAGITIVSGSSGSDAEYGLISVTDGTLDSVKLNPGENPEGRTSWQILR